MLQQTVGERVLEFGKAAKLSDDVGAEKAGDGAVCISRRDMFEHARREASPDRGSDLRKLAGLRREPIDPRGNDILEGSWEGGRPGLTERPGATRRAF